MSDTTTAISPAVYHQILQALLQGKHEMEMAVTTAPDGTQTQTIVIRPAAPVIVAPKQVEAPKARPQPKKQPWQIRRPSAPQCTASRGVMCSDGISRMNYLAARFERKKNRGRFERWFLNSWDE